MISVIIVGAFLVCVVLSVLYLIRSSSKGRHHYSHKESHETMLKLKQQQEMMKFKAREAERQRRLRDIGGRFRRGLFLHIVIFLPSHIGLSSFKPTIVTERIQCPTSVPS